MDRVRARLPVLRALCVALALIAAVASTAAARRTVIAPGGGGDRVCGDLRRLLCGTVDVPLDRSGRVPGTLHLRVLGDGSRRGRGTILVLDGTANGRATRRLSDYASGLDPLGARRVLTFDMRGTGASRLDCEALSHQDPLARAAADCAAELGPRRAFFTIADDVADAETVRAALGVERMTLYGFDYGTRVAAAYAAAHPEHVERLVLDSPAGPDGPDPLGRSTFAAIRRIAASTCARSCRFTHDALGELTALMQQLARGALHARVFDGRGRPHALAIGAAQVRDVLLAGDVSFVARMTWPPAVHAALAGDPALLARLVRTTAHASPLQIAGGALRLVRMCGGRVATLPGAGPLQADAFAPFTPQLAAEASPAGICAQWPDAPSAQPLAAPTGVPTLVRSGEGSIATPLEDAQALAARMPGAQLLALPLFGHEILSWSVPAIGDCSEDGLHTFALGRPVAACRRTQQGFVWPFAPPRSLADVAPRKGLRGRLGRTLHAARLTLLDAAPVFTDAFFALDRSDVIPGVTAPAYGGLHGGFVRFANDGFRLRRYSYVPGVTLTGFFGEKGALRIGGSAAVHGRLRLSDRSCGERACFFGRLGGRVVHLTVPGSA